MKRLVLVGVLLLGACGDRASDVMQGYGEADYIYLSSQEPGIVGQLFVAEGDVVEAGAPIFRLDPERLSLSAQEAAAQRASLQESVRAARADADLQRRNFARGAELAEKGFYPRARLDADRAARDAADARLQQAERQLRAAGAQTGLAEVRLEDMQGAASRAGRIERIFHRPGEVVAAGEPIVALLAPENMKVRFFAPEPLLSRLAVGARVAISCDGCADDLTARIIRVAQEPQFTPPVIYSLDRRDKLVFLVEARPDQPDAIRPGMPVDVRIADARP